MISNYSRSCQDLVQRNRVFSSKLGFSLCFALSFNMSHYGLLKTGYRHITLAQRAVLHYCVVGFYHRLQWKAIKNFR